jgi:threonine/homoserine/homoserine lactone efflux protein
MVPPGAACRHAKVSAASIASRRAFGNPGAFASRDRSGMSVAVDSASSVDRWSDMLVWPTSFRPFMAAQILDWFRAQAELTAALLGFVVGFVTSMPVAGPVSLLVFGRGLQGRGRSGIYLALGSAIAESMYAYLAFWGFSALLATYAWIEPLSRALTAVLLVALGVRFARMRTAAAPSDGEQAVVRKVGSKRSFLLGLTITALNPTLIATWSVVVAAIHSFDVVAFGAALALPFAIGVAFGSAAWFAVLLALLRRYKAHFPAETLDRTLRVMGIFAVLVGLYFGVKFVLYFQK